MINRCGNIYFFYNDLQYKYQNNGKTQNTTDFYETKLAVQNVFTTLHIIQATRGEI